MQKIYFLISALLFSATSFIIAQESNIVAGNLLVMVNSDAEANQLTRELSSINGISTNLKVERTLSQSMHIYLMTFDATSVNENLLLKAVKRNHFP